MVGDRHNALYPLYLDTRQNRQGQSAPTDEKLTVERGNIQKNEAAVYEKSEPNDFGTYSVNSLQSTSLSESALNSKMKTYLSDLGFYDGEKGGGYTEELQKALKCFQDAYWGSEQSHEVRRNYSSIIYQAIC